MVRRMLRMGRRMVNKAELAAAAVVVVTAIIIKQ